MDRSHYQSIVVLFIAAMTGLLAGRYAGSVWPNPIVIFAVTAGVIMVVDFLLTALLDRMGWGARQES